MDSQEISQVIASIGMDSDPAFRDVAVLIEPIPRGYGDCPLGLYFADIGTIIIPPDGDSSTLLHELGHRYGDYYYRDLSEPFAERFRMRYEPSRVFFFTRERSEYFTCPECSIAIPVVASRAVCPGCGAVYRKVSQGGSYGG